VLKRNKLSSENKINVKKQRNPDRSGLIKSTQKKTGGSKRINPMWHRGSSRNRIHRLRSWLHSLTPAERRAVAERLDQRKGIPYVGSEAKKTELTRPLSQPDLPLSRTERLIRTQIEKIEAEEASKRAKKQSKP